jgi:hypothetical protein
LASRWLSQWIRLRRGQLRGESRGRTARKEESRRQSKPHDLYLWKDSDRRKEGWRKNYSASPGILFRRPSDSLAVVCKKASRGLACGAMMLVSAHREACDEK